MTVKAAARLPHSKLEGDFGQGFVGQVGGAGLSCQHEVGPFDGGVGDADGFGGERFGAAGIGIAEEDAIHGARSDHAVFRELAGDGHHHGVATAVEMNLDGIDVEFGQTVSENPLELWRRIPCNRLPREEWSVHDSRRVE